MRHWLRKRNMFLFFERCSPFFMICDNFMCHFRATGKKLVKFLFIHRAHPFAAFSRSFSIQTTACRFFCCPYTCSCSFTLTARVHLSIKNIFVDKRKCLDENNEYGLPIMIYFFHLRVRVLLLELQKVLHKCIFYTDMEEIELIFEILWRWIDTSTQTYVLFFQPRLQKNKMKKNKTKKA